MFIDRKQKKIVHDLCHHINTTLKNVVYFYITHINNTIHYHTFKNEKPAQ